MFEKYFRCADIFQSRTNRQLRLTKISLFKLVLNLFFLLSNYLGVRIKFGTPVRKSVPQGHYFKLHEWRGNLFGKAISFQFWHGDPFGTAYKRHMSLWSASLKKIIAPQDAGVNATHPTSILNFSRWQPMPIVWNRYELTIPVSQSWYATPLLAIATAIPKPG